MLGFFLDNGEKLRTLEDVELERLAPVRTLEEQPEVMPWIADIWDMYVVLSTACRDGFGKSGIPVSEIESYLRMTDEPLELFDIREVIGLISSLDASHSEWLEKQRNKEKK